MKGLKRLTNILIAIFILSLTSCGSEKAKEKVVVVKEEKKEKKEMKHFHELPQDFQNLMVGYEGAIRNIGVFETIEKVKETETAELVEETDVYLKYKLIKDEKEMAYITYMFENKKVDAIQMKIMVHNNEDYEVFLAELSDFFTHKYGLPKITDDKDEVWKVKNSKEHEVDIISTAKGEKYEIEIDIS